MGVKLEAEDHDGQLTDDDADAGGDGAIEIVFGVRISLQQQ